jgi:hypothetical protein
MFVLGLGLVVGYAVQIFFVRKRVALERRAESMGSALEKAD